MPKHPELTYEFIGKKVLLVNLEGDELQVIGDQLRVVSVPYLYQIAEGNIPDHKAVRVFGHNADVGVTFEIVGPTSTTYNYLATAQTLNVISSDADDTIAGDGARTVTLTGLDGDYNEISETINMNGDVAQVTTLKTFLRVFDCYVATAGATGVNEGAITIYANDGVTTISIILANEGQTHSANYTVPAGHTLYVVQGWTTEASTKGSGIHFFIRVLGAAWRSVWVTNVLDSSYRHPILPPVQVPERTDLEIRALAIIAGADVTAGFEGWIEH